MRNCNHEEDDGRVVLCILHALKHVKTTEIHIWVVAFSRLTEFTVVMPPVPTREGQDHKLDYFHASTCCDATSDKGKRSAWQPYEEVTET